MNVEVLTLWYHSIKRGAATQDFRVFTKDIGSLVVQVIVINKVGAIDCVDPWVAKDKDVLSVILCVKYNPASN